MSTNLTKTPPAENNKEQGYHHNTHLCVNVKTRLVNDKLMVQGKSYRGVLRYDVTIEEFLYDELFTFTENQVSTDGKRNPKIYEGKCVNVHQRADGTLYPTLKRPQFTTDYTFQDFCKQASKELANLPCLLEEEKEAEQ
jgi:hypothetical protein